MANKRRIKHLRDITVDGIDYKWSAVDVFKIWRDKKLIFESGWYNRDKYPEVEYFTTNGITPGVVAKVIRQLNGTEMVVSIENLAYRIENEADCGIGYYSKHQTFDDKKAELLWVQFNEKHEELQRYLKENTKYYAERKKQEA
jgi:uncharacterized protein YjhX (UPF0386 family)